MPTEGQAESCMNGLTLARTASEECMHALAVFLPSMTAALTGPIVRAIGGHDGWYQASNKPASAAASPKPEACNLVGRIRAFAKQRD